MDRSGRFRRILSAARRASGARLSARGFALILVLWVLMFLSIIAVTLIHQTQEDARFERAMVEDAKAEALAEAGVVQAMAALSNPESDWLADGMAHQIRLGEGVVTVRIYDETGRIDLNLADDAMLVSMLQSTGVALEKAQRLAAAIEDYRDPDDIKRPGGAEAADYAAAKLDHRPKNAPFELPEELAQVMGMTPEILRAVYPLVTVYSPHKEVNLAAASDAVLRALPNMDSRRMEQARLLRDAHVPSRPPVVTVIATADTAGGGHFIRQATLRRTAAPGRPFEVLSWRRTWPEEGLREPVTSTPMR